MKNMIGKQHTFCNPLNIGYRYQDGYYGREAADPSIVMYRDEYYLFASHSEGYWVSEDMSDWHFIHIDADTMPEIEKFAPTAYVYKDKMYLAHSENGAIFKSDNPKGGKWEYVGRPLDLADPMIFVDEDERIYCYYGCSDKEPLYVVELDGENNMQVIKGPVACIHSDRVRHGFEVPGDDNTSYEGECWLEGAWLVKREGLYYLQYAVPGTEYRTYADGCYVSESPFGPFTYCENSPVSYKASGFVTGAGHGSLIQDNKGNWWKFGTVSISVNHRFERRIVMSPARFNQYGKLECNMESVDYPLYLPKESANPYELPGPNWQMISYKSKTECSSYTENCEAGKAVDEDIRTWWSAGSGNGGEFLQVDLGEQGTIHGIQINFADSKIRNCKNRKEDTCYQYTLEYSSDGEAFYLLIDKREEADCMKAENTSHDYYEMEHGLSARYLRLTNHGIIPGGGEFAVSGLRVFGKKEVLAPQKVEEFKVYRDNTDKRKVLLKWKPSKGAEGYLIRYGIYKDSLNISHKIMGKNEVVLFNLNTDNEYYFEISAFNKGGCSDIKKLD